MAEKKDVHSAYQIMINQMGQQRCSLEHLHDELFFEDCGPQSKSIIEISGKANTGKSLLLWQLMARCLPPTYFGGKYCSIVFIDLGHKFSKHHFVENIRVLLQQSNESCSAEEYEEVVHKCMESMTILTCYSTEEFDLALADLEAILIKTQSIALVAIDHLNAYYWLESETHLIRMKTHYATILGRLRQLCNVHNICCAYTVDTKYIHAASKNPVSSAASQIEVDYKIRLEVCADGSRTLNSRPIYIVNGDIHFEKGTSHLSVHATKSNK